MLQSDVVSRLDPALANWFLGLDQNIANGFIAELVADITHNNNLTFVEFTEKIYPYRQWPDYAYQLFDILERVANGELSRVMVFMPPRHFKSEIVSRLFSAYYLYRHPDKWVGLCSYAAELAYTLSRNSRENYTRAGGIIKDDAGAVKHWETGKGGGLWAAGVGGPILGKGFHLGIIDDPVKNSEEANSLVIQERNNDWYASTFSTRQEPGAAIVIIQQRWGIHDLSGHILEMEKEEPENWHIVHFEAIKGDGIPVYPKTCILEPDKRQPSEALNPLRYPVEKLEKISNRIGDFFFSALYQQTPIPRKGRVFHQFKGAGPDASELDYSKVSGYYRGHDFGAVNEVWGLYAKIGSKYYMIAEYLLPEGTTSSRAGMVKTACDGKDVVAGYGGAKGEKQIRLDYRKEGIDIRLPVVTDVERQVNIVNHMFEREELVICANCVHTIDQLQNAIRDASGKIANESTLHYVAQLRYLCAGVGGGLHWAM